jgi:uncharacterized membrane protein
LNNKDIQNDTVQARSISNTTTRSRNVNNQHIEVGDPLSILKLRLAKGEITKNEYNELYNAIA